MKKLILVGLALVFCLPSLSAQNKISVKNIKTVELSKQSLYGTITTSDGYFANDVIVTIYTVQKNNWANVAQGCSTDENGMFDMDVSILKSEEYSIVVNIGGYKPVVKRMRLPDEAGKLDIVLEKWEGPNGVVKL